MSLGPLSSFASSFTWATGVSYYSKLARDYDPPAINFSRALISFPLLLIILMISSSSGVSIIDQALSVDPRQWGWLIASVLASFAFADILFLFSTKDLGVPGGLALASTYIIWSSLAGAIFRGESIRLIQGLGIALIFFGTLVVILKGYHIKNVSHSHYVRGIILGMATSVLWSANTFSIAAGGENLNPVFFNLMRMGIARILCPLVGFILKFRRHYVLRKQDFPKALPFLVLEGTFGSLLFTYGLTHAPLATAATLSSLAPVISVPLAWAMKTEPVSYLKLVGVLTASTGVFLLVS